MILLAVKLSLIYRVRYITTVISRNSIWKKTCHNDVL